MITFDFPCRTVSLTNQREYWKVRAVRAYNQRRIVWAEMHGRKLPELPCTVKLTRVGVGTLDSDNLQGAMKSVRDEVAKQLGVDDNDPRITWQYDQERGKEYRVVIQITND